MDIGFLMHATALAGDLPSLARRTEEIGCDSLWIPEHPIIPLGDITPYPFGGSLPEHYGRWADPFVALTVAAAVTARLKLATGICLLPERETLVTAKVVASLDYYSKGRVLLGIGAGWLKEETEIMGSQYGTRWQRMREMSEAMRLLWTTDAPSYEGKQIRFPPVRSEPKPYQAGGPPFILGGHGDKALERIARSYDGWCPIVGDPVAFGKDVATLREMTRAAGRDPAKIIMSPFVDPEDGRISTATLKAYRDAGADRVVMFYATQSGDVANGAGPFLEKIVNVVERARPL
jgi:probable F420-dependent oxidoreductase